MQLLKFEVFLVIFSTAVLFTEGQDNTGSEFFIVFFENHPSRTPTFSLYITSAENENVSFSVRNSELEYYTSHTAQPGVITAITLDSTFMITSTTDRSKGVIVSAEGNRKLTVYGANEGAHTTDAFLALPSPILDIDEYHYMAAMYHSRLITSLSSIIAVVATKDSTTLSVRPSQNTYIGSTYTTNGSRTNITLNKAETLLIKETADLTGSMITSNKPISVFSGHQCTYIPHDVSACDVLVEQLPPVENWGNQFATAPLKERTSYDLFRIVSGENDNTVHISCVQSDQPQLDGLTMSFSLNRTNYRDVTISSTQYCWIEGSKKTLLLQFSVGQRADHVSSDPFMAMVPPVDQYSNSYTLQAIPSTLQPYTHHINILIPEVFYQPDDIYLNQLPLSSYNFQFIAIKRLGVTAVYATQIDVAEGVQTLHHANPLGRLGVLAYGFGNYNSYGYPGGLRLKDIEIADPYGVQATSSTTTSVTIQWHKPYLNSDVTGYEVDVFEHMLEKDLISSFNTTDTMAVITDLKPGTNYSVDLEAMVEGDEEVPTVTIHVQTEKIDLSECEEPCPLTCTTDKLGIYSCFCEQGYELTNYTECTVDDECLIGTHNCSQMCHNTPFGYQCSCLSGFVLTRDDDCIEFNKNLTSNIDVSEPTLVNIIRKHLHNCSDGATCTCLRTLFYALSKEGYGQYSAIQDREISIEIHGQLDVANLVAAIFGDNSHFLLPVVAHLRKMTYFCISNELLFEVHPSEGMLDLYPNVLTLSAPTLRLTIGNVTTIPFLSEVEIAGNTTLGNVTFELSVNMTNPILWTFIANSASDDNLNFTTFLSSAFGVEVPTEYLGKNLTLNSLIFYGGLNSNFGLDLDLYIEGLLYVDDWFEDSVCIHTHHNLISSSPEIPELGLLTGCDDNARTNLDFQLSYILSKSVGVNINNISYFNTLNLTNFQIVFATPSYSTVTTNSLPLYDIHGLWRMFTILQSNVSEQWLYYNRLDAEGIIVFQPLDPYSGSSSISSVFPSLTHDPFKNLLHNDIAALPIRSMTLNTTSSNLTLRTMKLNETIAIYPGVLVFSGIEIDFFIDLDGEPALNNYIIWGRFTLGNIEFEGHIEHNGQYFVLEACTNHAETELYDLLSSVVSVNPYPAELDALGLPHSGLYSPCIRSVLTVTPNIYTYASCIYGSIQQQTYRYVDAFGCMYGAENYTIGYEVSDVVLSRYFSQFVGMYGRNFGSFFSNPLNAAVIAYFSSNFHVSQSPVQFDTLSPLYHQLTSIHSTEGVALYTVISWADNCDINAICSILKDLLGPGGNFSFHVKFEEGRITATADVPDFTVRGFQMYNASINVQSETSGFTVDVLGSTIVSNPFMVLNGHLLFELEPRTSSVLDLTGSGCLENVFGVSIVDACNVHLTTTVSPTSHTVDAPDIAIFSAAFQVGKSECSLSETRGYLAIGMSTSASSHFYTEIDALYLSDILGYFCANDSSISNFLSNIVLYPRFTVSFAHTALFIDELGLNVSAGLSFQGQVEAFGVTTFATFQVPADNSGLIGLAKLPSLTLAQGLLKVKKSRSLRSQGPNLHFLLPFNHSLSLGKIEFVGFFSVLGIQIDGVMAVHPTRGFDLFVNGTLMGTLDAEAHIQANLGNIYHTNFRVVGKLKQGLLRKIEEKALDRVPSVRSAAFLQISSIQSNINDAQKVFDTTIVLKREAEMAIMLRTQEVSRIKRVILALHMQWKEICGYQPCRQVCVTRALCGQECTSVCWNGCFLLCSRRTSCCNTSDWTCLLHSENCRKKKEAIEVRLREAFCALTVARELLSDANIKFKSAEVLVLNSQRQLDAMKYSLLTVSQNVIHNFGHFYADINSTVGHSAIHLREISFDARLEDFYSTYIPGVVTVSFFHSSPVQFRVQLPVATPTAVASKVAVLVNSNVKKKNLIKPIWLREYFKNHGTIYPK